jgi:DNA-binding protein H-NS
MPIPDIHAAVSPRPTAMPRESLVTLRKQIARLEAQARKLEATQASKKKEAVGQVAALMRKLGVTVADLQEGPPARGRRARTAPADGTKTAARAPVPVKFRDATTGDAWSGRGRTPRWLAAHEAQGRSRDEFRVG